MPERVRDEVRVEVDVAARHLTIVECRPPWRADVGAEWTRFPIARLRYVKTSGVWSLFWRDRNLRFHAYDLAAPTASIEELLANEIAIPRRSFGADRLRSMPSLWLRRSSGRLVGPSQESCEAGR